MAAAPARDPSSKSRVPLNITIEPAQLEDLDAIAAISEASFETDTHTQLKAQFHGANSHGDGMRDWIKSLLDHPKVNVLVARDTEASRVVGSIVWGRRGFQGDVDKPMDKPTPPEPKEGPKKIGHLEEITNFAMEEWSRVLMPEGSRCRYIIALNVDPAYQGRGVGSRLMDWGTQKADEEGVYCWVGSSMGAVKAYEKQGFREIGRLEADLDEYAEGKKRIMEDGSEGLWGQYIWPFMKRDPRT